MKIHGNYVKQSLKMTAFWDIADIADVSEVHTTSIISSP
jgi:hypothetical protein